MTIIKHILTEELGRLQQLLTKFKSEIEKLPKGSLSKKNRNGHLYFYRAQRVHAKIKFEYIGKEGSPAVGEALDQYKKRVALSQKIQSVKKDINEIEKAINGKK